MPRYDLITERWVPVVEAGRRSDVSLIELFEHANDISGLALDDPLQMVAILRQVVLPVWWEATGFPRSETEWAVRWASVTSRNKAVHQYLAMYADRFDLFHSVRPFAQAAGLQYVRGGSQPVSRLIPNVATGNNVPLYGGCTEADAPPLSAAEAARAVLTIQCWDPAVPIGRAVGDTLGTTPLVYNQLAPTGKLGVIIPTGRNLAETLVLNTPILKQGVWAGDMPQWRHAQPADASWQQRPAKGVLDLLTWQPRRICLIPSESVHGHLQVTEIIITAGDKLDQIPIDVEVHTAWRVKSKPTPGQRPEYPATHEPGRSAWRGLSSLVATGQVNNNVRTCPLIEQLASVSLRAGMPTDYPLQVVEVGAVYGAKSAIIMDTFVDTTPVPVAALPPGSAAQVLLIEVVTQIEDMRRAADWLRSNIQQAAGRSVNQTRQDSHLDDGLGEHLVFALEPIVRRLITDLQTAAVPANILRQGWQDQAFRTARLVADAVIETAPPAAFLGRTFLDSHKKERTIRLSSAANYYYSQLRDILGFQPATLPKSTTITTGAA